MAAFDEAAHDTPGAIGQVMGGGGRPPGGKNIYKSPGHKEDWFEGIRTGRKTIMNIAAGVATANLTILGNIAYILGRKIQWDPVKQEIVGDDEANAWQKREQRAPYLVNS